MKKILLSVALLSVGMVSFAQQDAQYTQNMFNKLAINPAYAGMNKLLCGTTLYRTQWVKFPGAPKTFLLSADMGLPILHGGVGLTVLNDQLGADHTVMAKAAYSFQLPLKGGAATLGIGIEAGALIKTLKDQWIAPDGSNGTGDPAIPVTGLQKTTYDIGLGVFYQENEGRTYFGISSTHLPQNSLKDGNLKFEIARHYYIQAGHAIRLNDDFALIPSVFVKSDAASLQMDANLCVEWQKMLWLGGSYRLTDAIAMIIGGRKEIGTKGAYGRIGFAYDITTSQIKNYSNNTIEVMLGFCYPIIPPPRIETHRNVRLLHEN